MTPGAHDPSPAAALNTAIRARDPRALDGAIAAARDTPGALDACDADGETPLRCAICEGWADAVERLLEAGADPNLGSRPDYGPLPLSIGFGEYEIASLLMRAPGCNLRAQGYRAALAAVSGGDAEGLCCLAEGGLDLRATAPPEAGEMGSLDLATALLFNAAAIGLVHAAVFEFLLAHGADAAAAVAGGTLPVALCCRANEAPESLRLLLDAGAPAERPDAEGHAPLHHAAARDHVESTRLLLAHGAPPAQLAGDGSTSLLWAAANGRGWTHSVLLAHHGPAEIAAVVEAMDHLSPHLRWNPGSATWGALAPTPVDGAWLGVAWAEAEEAVMSRLDRTFASARGASPPCLLLRLRGGPDGSHVPAPWLDPRRPGTIRTGQAMTLNALAPHLAGGIPRSLPSDPDYRFVLSPSDPDAVADPDWPQARSIAVEVVRIVTFYDGRRETIPAVLCKRAADTWSVRPAGE